MNPLRRWFGGKDTVAPVHPVRLDLERRTEQLQRLEAALDELIARMRDHAELLAIPGWRERIEEYRRASGAAYALRRGGAFSREQLLDLVYEIRPVADRLPPALEAIGPVQDEVMAAVEELRIVLPEERPPAEDGR